MPCSFHFTVGQLVVVGNGMAGVACVEQILKHAPRVRDHGLRRRDARQLQPHPALVGARRRESRPTRSRSTRSSGTARNDIRLRARRPRRPTSIRPLKTVTGDDGSVTPFDTLMLATGSSAVHAADRRRRQGQRLRLPHARRHARAARSARGPACKAVVIGGGLLGLEAARGLQVQGCDVTVVHLMRHADGAAARPDRRRLPAGKMESLGVRVLLGQQHHRRFSATASVEGVRVRRRRRASTPTWWSSPRASGPTSSSAARPDSTSTAASSSTTTWRRRDPDIFAVGECVEHRGSLLRPGGAAARAGQGAGGHDHRQQRARLTRGTVPAAKLKIMGVDVFSAGDWSDAARRRAGALRGSGARHLQEAAARRTASSPA